MTQCSWFWRCCWNIKHSWSQCCQHLQSNIQNAPKYTNTSRWYISVGKKVFVFSLARSRIITVDIFRRLLPPPRHSHILANSTTFHAQLVTPGPWASPRTATSCSSGKHCQPGKNKVFLLCLALGVRVNGREAPRRRERGCVRPSTQADCWEKLALPDTQFTKTLIIRRWS